MLLIDGDAVAAQMAHQVLGVKFILISLINVEIQKSFDIDEQYIMDCLCLVLETCNVSKQGAIDCAATKGVELLLYLSESYPNLVLICLKIVRLLLCSFPAVMLSSFFDKANLAHMCDSDEVEKKILCCCL